MTRMLDRRKFLLYGSASLFTSTFLKACQRTSSLQAVSVSAESQPPTGLIVALHGRGGNGQNFSELLVPQLKGPKYQLLFPNAPFAYSRQPEGRMWYDLDTPDFQGLEESRQILTNWLKSLESQTGVPLSRTVLSGFSQGGAMTLDVGLRLPLAGLVCIGGFLQVDVKPAEGSVPPVLILHGKKDTVIPPKAAQEARDKLKALGVQVQYQEFNMGHEIPSAVVDAMQSFVEKVLDSR